MCLIFGLFGEYQKFLTVKISQLTIPKTTCSSHEVSVCCTCYKSSIHIYVYWERDDCHFQIKDCSASSHTQLLCTSKAQAKLFDTSVPSSHSLALTAWWSELAGEKCHIAEVLSRFSSVMVLALESLTGLVTG